jgi:hypothetical protein
MAIPGVGPPNGDGSSGLHRQRWRVSQGAPLQ